MRNWLAMKLVSRTMAALRTGDYGPTLRLDADDVSMHFPGTASWAGDYKGKAVLREWYERFVEIGLQIYPDDIMVKGWPWNMTMAVRGHIYLDDPAGARVYDNRYVIWGRLRWGKLAEYETYEDTQKSVALDAHLGVSGTAA
jgi:ketosteroid isomerase-like protein